MLGSDVVLDLDWEKTTLWVAGEYGIYCIQKDTMAASSVDNSRYLQAFSLGGDGFAAMFYTNYQGGSAGSPNAVGRCGGPSAPTASTRKCWISPPQEIMWRCSPSMS